MSLNVLLTELVSPKLKHFHSVFRRLMDWFLVALIHVTESGQGMQLQSAICALLAYNLKAGRATYY